MKGLFLLSVAAVWFFFVWRLTVLLTKKMPSGVMTTIAEYLLFAVLLVLPLADEIVGGRQFAQLCKENSKIQVDRVNAAGKTVYLSDLPDIQIKGTWVPIRLQLWRFVDTRTGEPVVSYNILYATGGRLVRTLSIFEGNVPLTFKSSCEPGGRVDSLKLFKELGVTQVQRSTLNIMEQK